MTGQRIGYIRVSSASQNTERQLEGIELDRCFIDKASAKDTNRPELNNLLSFVRDGDTLIVHSMDRLARNLTDLRELVTNLTRKGIKIPFVTEKLEFSGEDNPMSILLLSVMGAFAEFERALLKERQCEGIALVKAKGVYKISALPNKQMLLSGEILSEKNGGMDMIFSACVFVNAIF